MRLFGIGEKHSAKNAQGKKGVLAGLSWSNKNLYVKPDPEKGEMYIPVWPVGF